MIAASDPQEFLPSGRQQVARHPGPPQLSERNKEIDDIILTSLEKVSLSGHHESEWWILRNAPFDCEKQEESSEQDPNADNKSYAPLANKSQFSQFSDLIDDSPNKADDNVSRFSRRISDPSSRFTKKRHSGEGQQQKSSKASNEVDEITAKIYPGFMEDELYIKGNTAIWSRGLVNNTDNLDNGRITVCCYTVPLPIRQALWSTFYCERPSYDQSSDVMHKADEPNGIPVEAMCLIDPHNIRVFTIKGEQYVIAIPFQISKVWSTKFGIFIAKEDDDNFKENIHEPLATLYSLAYPLDDVCPAAINQSAGIGIYTNSNMKIVFTSNDPSICMAYDSTSKVHSVFKIRKLKLDEKDQWEKGHGTTRHSVNSNKYKSRLSIFDNLFSNTQMITPSSIPSKPTNLGNLFHLQRSKSYTSMATISRCQTPSSVGSPWPQSFNTGSVLKNNQTNQSKSFFDCSKSMSHLRSTPTICLEYLWSENVQDANTAGPASKVFLTQDMVGQWYLCYILPSKFQLSIVKVDFLPQSITFGVSTSISAKDAVAITHLHMLAILEHSGNVTLYSGLTIVGKLHVGGTLAQHVPSPFVRRNMPSFNSLFPRRSSLLPLATASEPKFDEHLLSPVLPTNIPNRQPGMIELDRGDRKAVLTGLTDAVANRLTLKYSDGTFYRITLPILASSLLVENCLTVLKRCLPRDAALNLLSRWYATRNVIGAKDVSSEQEWTMFSGLIYELLGYEEEQTHGEVRDVPETTSKKHRLLQCGTDEDWEYLLNSGHKNVLSDLSRIVKIDFESNGTKKESKKTISVNPKSVLFPYIRQIHFVLHLLYEDLKLNMLRNNDLQPLMKMLNKLSNDLNLREYCVFYWKDFPKVATLASDVHISENYLKLANSWSGMNEKPVSIMEHVYNLLQGDCVQPYPFLEKVNNRSRDIVQLCGVLSLNNLENGIEIQLDSFIQDFSQQPHKERNVQGSVTLNSSMIEQVVVIMVQMKITTRYLETLPTGIYFLFYNALWKCRESPPSDWPIEAYNLLWRDDLVAQAHKIETVKDKVFQEKMNICYQLQESMPNTKQEILDLDGMEDIDSNLTKMIFCEDMRVAEARKMLASSKPVPIVLVQRPDVSDHDFIEEQEKHLYGLCIRTMALPVGRGMFTLRTATPIITEPLAAPTLCLTGKAPPRGATVDLNHIDTPANMNLWPLFHNGVANGLRVTPDAQNIDNTWIIFNKPKGGVEPHMEHAGFLMALGLNGHLRNLAILSTFDYLWKLHEMTSVGVLLGLSAAFRGTSHQSLTKILAIHVEALLPPTSMELDVPQNLQVAGLLGLGLVYQRTAHRHITEVLLSEIGRPPGPEMENSVDRESYSLAAGLALGLVTLKHGGRPTGLADLNVPDMLHYYMVGGNRRPLVGSQKDKYKTPSFQIREGFSVNLDVTAPGATLALGLMYLGTGNKAIADWMSPPETQYLLDFVRPDFLMLRILSRSLIMWNEVEPTKEWVEGNVPSTIRPYCMVKPSHTNDIDYEAMNQAYCNIVAGSCFAMGLKFAGTADKEAFETLLFFCHMFTSLTGKSIAELAGKATIETCLNVLLLSASMVMAGTGNLEIMRLVRHLRRRVGIPNSAIVTYGSHLAVHMSLGLLFLGGGRYTLSNSPSSIAALICAFYPKFPTHSNDNRYHLQAFRHLYVLAVEPRLVIPKDVMTDEICYANLNVVKLDCKTANNKVRGPGLIPDLSTLMKVTVEDERYWPVVFERGRNWDLLLKIMSTTGYIEVKQRAGCLSYIVDKFGYHSQLARTLTQSNVVPWDPSPSNIVSFTSDECIKKFCDNFLGTEKEVANLYENRLTQMLTKVTYEAVVKDKLVIIVVLISMIKAVLDLNQQPNTLQLWQLKLISSQVLKKSSSKNLISKEAVLALLQEVTNVFDKWEDKLKALLKKYLSGEDFNEESASEMLASYCVFYDMPYKVCLPKMEQLELLVRLKSLKLKTDTIRKVVKVREN